MANNEYVNKVLFGNTTVMDISDTTAETEDVIEGQVFYTKSGAPAVGSLGDATTSTHGLMSAEDKVKLDNINEIQIDKTLDTSAAIMSFPDGADGMPVKSLSVAVEPVQDLHGYDNPWPAGGGKNLVQNNSVSEVIDGVTFTVHSDGTVTANGTASAEIYFNIKSGLSLEAGSYVLSGCPAGGSTSTYRIFATNVGSDIGSSLAFTFNETTATTVRINIKSGTTITNLLFKPMICLSSAQNPTTFAPYSNICPITGWTGANVWDDPAYGGKIKWNQCARNGNFADGTNNWRVSSNAVSISAQDGILTIAVASSLEQWTNVSGSGVGDTSAGRKLLISVVGRGDRGNPNPGVTNTYALAGVKETEGSWVRVSKLLNTVQGSHVTQVYFDSYSSYVTGDKMQLKSVNVFDLTRMFGETVADQIYAMEQAMAGSGVAWFRNLFPVDFYAYDSGTEKTVSEVNGNPYRHIEVAFDTPTPGTVYGGTLTINEDGTGVLVVNRAMKLLNGSESWSWNQNNSLVYTSITGGVITDGTTQYNRYTKNSTFADRSWVGRGSVDGTVGMFYGLSGLFCKYSKITSGQEAQAFFTANPTTVVYQLATPVTYQLTNQQVIETLEGMNNVWVDTGDINSITYSKLTSGLINTYDKVKLDQIEGLPPVTSSDNNKILQVTNGVWDAATLTNANSSVAGLMSATDKTKLDGIMAGANKPVFLTYGSSTWSDAITAYNNGAQLYCLASNSMDTPGSGTMNRIVQLVYVAIGSDDTIPYQFEFQYYRSLSSKTLSALSDQILVYKLDQNDGWSFSYRYISIEEVSASNGITASYNNNILSLSGPGIMTGATSSTAGTSGSVPAPTTSDVDKFLAGDGTYKSGGLPMVILSYGNSTWAEFEAAYKNNVIVYCRASSNSNPASGSQTRMAFMAYVNNSTAPTNVEFQYYRSMNPSNKSINQLSDQVYVYKLDKTSGWSVTTREASIKSVVFDASTGLTGTYNYSTGVLTITAAT